MPGAGEDAASNYVQYVSGVHLPEVPEGVEIWRRYVGDVITSDPVAVALECQRLMDALFEGLMGIPRSSRVRRTAPDFSSREPGMCGRARGFFVVSELQGRKQLHWHALVWCGLPCWVPQRAAGLRCPVAPADDATSAPDAATATPSRPVDLARPAAPVAVDGALGAAAAAADGPMCDFGAMVTRVLNSYYIAQAPAHLHAAHLFHRTNGTTETARAAYWSPPPAETAVATRERGVAVAVQTNVHSHCASCRKGRMGPSQCRLCYPRACNTSQTPRRIVAESRAISNSNKVRLRPRVHDDCGPPPACPERPPAENATLHDEVRRAAMPGGDTRLLNYTIGRDAVVPPPELVQRRILTAADGDTLLRRAHARLRVAALSIGANTGPLVNSSTTTEELSAAVNGLVAELHLHRHNPAGGESPLSDHEDILTAFAALPPGRLVPFLDYYTTQNSLVGETHPAIIAAVGCSFNAQPLVSTEAAMNAIFYLLDYVSAPAPRVHRAGTDASATRDSQVLKDGMRPADLIGFLKAARQRYFEYEGTAPAGEDPQAGSRPYRRLMQIMMNGMCAAAEVGIQQCALNDLGLPSHYCSESFSHVFAAPAVRERRRESALARGEPAGIAIDAEVARGAAPSRRRGIETGAGRRVRMRAAPDAVTAVRAAAAARALTLAARHVVRFQRVRVCSLRLRLQATGQSHLRTTHDGGLPLGGAGAFAGAARMAQQWYARAVGPCMFAIEWCFS